ncbi:MAG TPA: sulfotransferase [Steroidobacteraceae bacterium]|nr:sulfotransferase [Steroidobacteraceae bacterium]
MSASADLEIMRASMLLETDAAAAARRAGALLMAQPGHEAASLLLTEACRRLGDSSSAIEIMEGLARAQPESAVIQLELGRTYAACARSGEAQAALQRAAALDPNLADAWLELAGQRLLSQETASADAAYAQYRRLAGNPPDLAEAYLAFDQRRLDAAEQCVQQRLRAGTNQVAAFTLLAAVALLRGDDLAEEAALNQILSRAPCDGGARAQLAHLMIRQGRGDEALRLIERLLAAQPDARAYRLLKLQALQLIERHADGLGLLKQLIADQPDDADLWLLSGHQQRYLGHSREAIESYRRAIALRPGHGMAYWALANFETFRFGAEDVETMQSRLALAPPGGTDATGLEFSLGRAREDRREFAASFEHYARGNASARASFHYDPNATTAFVQRFKATFTERFFAERAEWGHTASDPIFVVGLPRSGSTLLEQILASHSAVEGTRELEYVPTLARELAGPPQTASRYPENLVALERSLVAALAARYLASAGRHRPLCKPRFVDKMHGNFASLGLLHLMFPHAAIVDCRRHPMACGFGCYKQLFNPGMNFAYDLDELGTYYRDYADLMDHADRVLPGRVYRLYYERLVTDTENEVRRLLDYCRLPYEPQCLRFHENRRVAQTISLEQVQRPIYTAGLEHWRHYAPWLDPLSAALHNLPQDYPRFQKS